jgi:glycosyltransferase involved in cell wall biosynthesis
VTHAFPLVSIVTPSYNQACFLEETLLSVQRQDYPRIEHIVVDGGSSDGSVDIIRRHETRLARWVSERDNGQSDAIRMGFAMATGGILAWLNSDDTLMPGAVGVAVRELTRDPALGLVYGDRLEIDERGNVVGTVRLPSHRRAMFRRNFTIPQETAFFRRTHYEAVGGVDVGLHFAMDFDLWVRLSEAAPMRHLPVFLGCYRRHDTSKSVEMDTGHSARGYREESEAVYRKHFGRRLPSRNAMALYRLALKTRAALEAISSAGRRERSRLLKELREGW